ncbi:MAG: HAMP domain-containing protein [Acidobacteriales bacterium]|nr:HAMP domain-containing protein [Terriglobales bacterium]
MRSLFLRIFFSVWLALAVFLVLAILLTLAMRPPISGLEAAQGGILTDAVSAYERGGSESAHRYLLGLAHSEHIRAFLFNEQGQELSGWRAPAWIQRAGRGEGHSVESFWGRLGLEQFLRSSMTGTDGHHYTLVIALPGDPRFLHAHGMPWLTILIAFVSTGLACYMLARYLTAPITRLRGAAQALASGDLTARAGQPGSRRNDEMAELVRDFDSMASRLQDLVTSQSRLLSDISHELRSPLARLNVALGLARLRAGKDADSALERIDLEANRLNELIGRLLTLARLEGGTDAIHKSPVRLDHLVTDIAADADFEAQRRRCRVQVTAADPCIVLGDATLLHSAIENVMRNATNYTREDSTVRIRLQRIPGDGGPQALVQVADSGPGVPEETLDKLFRPFYRIDDARGRSTGGVGLGLAITERAVRLHGGSIHASNGAGGGLVVEIRLPLIAGGLDSVNDGRRQNAPATEVSN